jgi:PAS domain S-box-containing protein
MLSMQWQVLYIISIIITIFLMIMLLFYAIRRRNVPGARYFVGFMLTAIFWTLNIGVMALVPPQTGYFWLSIKYFWIAVTPVILLLFVLDYINRDAWLNKWFIAVLLIIPFVTQIVVWTNNQHGLMIRDLQFVQAGILTYIPSITFGPYYWVHTGYSYVLALFSMVLVVITILRGSHLYRGQGLFLIAGILGPFIANILLIAGIAPREIDPLPFALFFTSLFLWWSVFRYQMLDLVPVARDIFVDIIPNSMLAFDNLGRIIDINKSMSEMIGTQPDRVIGLPVTEVLKQWPDLVENFRDETNIETDTFIGPRWVNLLIRPLTNRRGNMRGRLIVLRDITHRKTMEEEREKLILTLQDALSEVKKLSGLLPICASCKKIRDDKGYWQDVAVYVRDHSEAEFSHGICPDCMEELYPEYTKRIRGQEP